MKLDPQMRWIISMDIHELRLVLKSLGGRLSENEQKSAKILCDQITRQRVSVTKAMLGENDKLLKNLAL